MSDIDVRLSCLRFAAIVGVVAVVAASWSDVDAQPRAVTWRLDNLEAIGGHPVTLAGAPRVVRTDIGPVVEFNGTTDGLFLDVNPLAGLARFTLEVLFQPAPGGPEEQRFLHIGEPTTMNRALIELRMLPEKRWSLDTYLQSGETGVTLIDRKKTHAAGQWHVASLICDGTMMAHYVDGVRELSAAIAFAPLGAGRTSIGVRQNSVSWFQGRIHSIRITPDVLPVSALMRVP